MEKNQKLMWRRIERKIEKWRQLGEITEFELFQFLEQNKAMLQSFQLDEAERLTERLLLFVSDQSDKKWSESEWLPLLRQIQEEIPLAPSPAKSPAFSKQEKKEPLLLIIDDDIEFITYMKDFLENNEFQVLVALTGKKGLELFYDVNPDLVLLDYVLPDIDGISLLTQIVEKARNEFTPVMMVSAHISDEHRTLSFNLGVSDFIGKPINTDIFLPFLHNRLSARQQILKRTLQDELTGAFNRRFMEKELLEQIERFNKEEDYFFSLAMVDLDHFKSVNDTYGHHMGDQVLETLVNVFEKQKDPEDSISRYGGEEFTIIFPHTDGKDAIKKLQKWRETFSHISFTSGNAEFHVTFSSGVKETSRNPRHGKEVLEQADKALYHAKHSGRNQTVLYSSALEALHAEEPINLLIIDDDPLARNLLETFFVNRSSIGNKPVKVTTYESGDELLAEDWYDSESNYVLLLDSTISVKNGIDIITSIKQMYGAGNIAIAILAAQTEVKKVEEALKAEVDDYLLKPFETEEVGARLDVVVDRMFD
ncbi:diguanylate cyclase [Salimicrobium flavidum]|uniref:Diguanylate cyclase (GGDEF) domain-containing protein n=1 Tax=Salimicrobium flavidum TaxID=570947 RepID=A0A1N7KX28_9BACI|nr:diguanylate cyclase [Salimicrobium flavidum]SIS66153.1 diguanylate cyclase (GGDEF) domain-containing protein [Salimicrobium flavidum]